ncbi:MAG: type II toxin-antitoxin system Phd/YefM family antitoxin [Thermoanaerobaculia bacterium]|nr:type II toxin-antitoxin system Phd/YefM family antitoxin [Thermoanaerobaculia bacterium]
MKEFQVSEDIVPIGEFKSHASKLIGRVRESHRPLVITQNGRPAAVLIHPEEFDRLAERSRFIARVEEGLADAENERVVKDANLREELKRLFG